MKTALPLVLVGFSLMLSESGKKEATFLKPAEIINPLLSKNVAFCGIPAGKFYSADSLAPIEIMPGLGNWQHKVSTQSVKAQSFFNQGLSLIYAFNHEEAVRSFNEAIKLDPYCAMAYWGIAHAYGPNINLPMTEASEKLAYESIQKAKQLVGKVSAQDAAYINALALRYGGGAQKREEMDNAYISAMKKLADDYPGDADAQTLYADALMNTFPWQYWEKNRSFKPKALDVLKVLDNVLAKYPQHPGANHLLIHLVEGSANPEKGLQSAAVLPYLMPRAGHIVHMPSHIYIRTGNFDKAAQANIKAIRVDEVQYGKVLPAGVYAMYYGHNIHFLYFTTNMLGQSQLSLEAAKRLIAKVPKEQLADNAFFQELSIVPYYAMIRFGKWDDMLSQPKPADNLPYMQSIWQFGRGLALTRKNNLAQASQESAGLDSLSKLEVLKTTYASLDPVSNTVGIANAILKGELEIAEGRTDKGLAFLRDAVKMEENLIYNEPPTWPIPVRQFLGAALLNAKRYAEAEKIYREDLGRHPENGWSLFGLKAALEAQAKNTDAAMVNTRYNRAWSRADVKLMASRF